MGIKITSGETLGRYLHCLPPDTIATFGESYRMALILHKGDLFSLNVLVSLTIEFKEHSFINESNPQKFFF